VQSRNHSLGEQDAVKAMRDQAANSCPETSEPPSGEFEVPIGNGPSRRERDQYGVRPTGWSIVGERHIILSAYHKIGDRDPTDFGLRLVFWSGVLLIPIFRVNLA
jgi:hypothetical protein